MALSPQVEAALITVAGDWARHLANVEPKYRKVAFARMIRRRTQTLCQVSKLGILSSTKISFR